MQKTFARLYQFKGLFEVYLIEIRDHHFSLHWSEARRLRFLLLLQ